MNSLSWLIYLAGVSDSLLNLFLGVSIILFIVLAISVIVYFVFIMEEIEGDPRVYKIWKIGVPILVVSTLASIILPDRRTVLMIAASEIGQRALASPTAQEIIDPSLELLKKMIQKEVEKTK